MAVILNAGFHGHVTVQDKAGRELHQRYIASEAEGHRFIGQYGKSVVQGWSILKASMIPIRTDNCRDFCKDFFLPTFVNNALAVNNCVLKIVASIFAILWDLATFLPRFIATPFRLIYNCNSPVQPHPLTQFGANAARIILHKEIVEIQGDQANWKIQEMQLDVCTKESPDMESRSKIMSHRTNFARFSDGHWYGICQ